MVACDIHPLNNLRVNLYLRDRLGADEEARMQWQHHWMELGFAALETMMAQSPQTGTFCHGDAPTLADICLIPQLANARRVHLDLAAYPTPCASKSRRLRFPRSKRLCRRTSPMRDEPRSAWKGARPTLDLDRFLPYRLSVLTKPRQQTPSRGTIRSASISARPNGG